MEEEKLAELFKKIKERKTHEYVAIQIKKLIDEGKLKSGEMLFPESELANMMGVSRSSVREALRILELVGYVETKQGIGTYVSKPTTDRVIQRLSEFCPEGDKIILYLLEAREMLEPLAAKLAAQRADHKDLHDMEQALNQIREKIGMHEIIKEEAVNFHFCIGKASKNPIIAFMLDSILDLLKHSTKITYSVPGRPEISLKEHEQILEAIKERNSEKAYKLMKNHLQEVRAILEKMLKIN